MRLFLTLCFAALFAFGNASSCRERPRRANVYLIPDGYIGWIRIDRHVPTAPPLPIEDNRYLIVIPANGMLSTSAPIEEGWAKDEYYYYDGRKRQLLPHTAQEERIWGHGFGHRTAEGEKESRYEQFFVGTEEQFKKIGLNSKDENGNLKIGPISP